MSQCSTVLNKFRSKSYLTKIAALLVIFVWHSSAWGAQIETSHDKDLQIMGPITPGDADQFAEILSERFPTRSRNNLVLIDSEGGDIYEAMLLGRLVREYDLMVVVEEQALCYSSCVMLLAGGTQRAIFGKVGIHRPYFAAAGPDTHVQSDYQRLIEDLRAYFLEMTIPVALVDLMMSVPPEETHLLNQSELALYLPKDDPIANEIATSIEADKRRITTAELRTRQAKAEIECTQYSRKLEQAKIAKDDSQKLIAGYGLILCKDAISWGLSEKEYAKRNELATKICADSSDADCRWELLREQ